MSYETNNNATTGEISEQISKLNSIYTTAEIIIALFAVIGNSLIVYVFIREKQLKKKTNYYLASLAAADLLVGLFGIPFAIFASIGLPNHLYACLFTLSVLLSICTVSIFSLVAVCIDRYWMIVFPTSNYSTTKNSKAPLVVIAICWFLGTLIGMLPLFGWNLGPTEPQSCHFMQVVHPHYLAFIFFTTTLVPAAMLLVSYTHIYLVVRRQARLIHQMTTTHPKRPRSADLQATSSHRREVKMTKNLVVIVAFFIACWMPIHLHNCIRTICKTCPEAPLPVIEGLILISHLNSAINPVLYAYHLRDFRNALKAIVPKCFGVSIVTQHPPSSSF